MWGKSTSTKGKKSQVGRSNLGDVSHIVKAAQQPQHPISTQFSLVSIFTVVVQIVNKCFVRVYISCRFTREVVHLHNPYLNQI